MKRSELGLINPLVVTTAVLAVLVLALGGFSVWAFMNYTDQKDNVDAKVSAAEKVVKQQQKDEDTKAFAEQEKKPTRQFIGPDDLGRVTFDYPKTWSVYIYSDGSSGRFEAFLQPGAVANPDNARSSYAAHVTVDGTRYEEVLRQFQDIVASGKLKATAVTVSGQTGVRLDGQLTDTVQGSIVIFKVRDKTLRITCEVPGNIVDLNTIIMTSLKFNS